MTTATICMFVRAVRAKMSKGTDYDMQTAEPAHCQALETCQLHDHWFPSPAGLPL